MTSRRHQEDQSQGGPSLDLLLVVAMAAATLTAVLYDGGFSPASRLVFAALALAALACALVSRKRLVVAFARRPVVLALAALALLGAASALWTLGWETASLRWALVTAAYTGLVLTGAAVARTPGGPTAIAVTICLAAFAAGAVGLVGVAFRIEPFAERIGGSWRPGGTLEYPPALALLQVSALPILFGAVRRPGRALAAGAAMAGMAVAAAVLALAASRIAFGLVALLALAVVAWPRRAVGTSRARALALVGALLAVGLATHWAAGGYSPPADQGAAAQKGRGGKTPQLPPRVRAGLEPDSGFLHGRPDAWGAALEIFADRPLQGAGADAFLVASAPHQDHGPVRYAHSLPLELTAELGIGGALLVGALYLGTGAAIWRARRRPSDVVAFGPAAAAFLIAGLLDWPWHLAGCGAVWALALGALLAAGEENL